MIMDTLQKYCVYLLDLLFGLIDGSPQQMLHIIDQIDLFPQLDLDIINNAVRAISVHLTVVQWFGGDVKWSHGGI